MRAYLCAFAALVLAAPASATWYRASSEHFIIYSDQEPERVRQFALNLERFDTAVRSVRGMSDLPLSQGNRLTIFRLSSAGDVQRLIGDDSGMVQGFYKGNAAGSLAVVGPGEASNARPVFAPGSHIVRSAPNTNLSESTILLHEYAHHLMMQDLRVPYPQWLVEGFAEFMSSAEFGKDGSVGLGRPATHRYAGLMQGRPLPLETMLAGNYDELSGDQVESLYGRGWLLTHYLTFEPARKGQLATYLTALANGVAPLDAARQSFGDLKQLDRDLEAYLRRRQLRALTIDAAALGATPIEIAPLSAGGAAVIGLRLQAMNGVPEGAAEAFAARVRAVQARYPDDELVESTLARAELDAHRPDAAEAAADRALKRNPRSTEAMILKGLAIEERAASQQGPQRKSSFEQARRLFIAANAIDKEDPEPLMEFYEAYVREGSRPTANALAALHYASDLAPQDLGLRMTSALAHLSAGDSAKARRALVPIAFDPHGRKFATGAKQVIARIDAGDVQGALAAGSRASKELEAPAR